MQPQGSWCLRDLLFGQVSHGRVAVPRSTRLPCHIPAAERYCKCAFISLVWLYLRVGTVGIAVPTSSRALAVFRRGLISHAKGLLLYAVLCPLDPSWPLLTPTPELALQWCPVALVTFSSKTRGCARASERVNAPGATGTRDRDR